MRYERLKTIQIKRLTRILAPFVTVADSAVDDDQFVTDLVDRYRKDRIKKINDAMEKINTSSQEQK